MGEGLPHLDKGQCTKPTPNRTNGERLKCPPLNIENEARVSTLSTPVECYTQSIMFRSVIRQRGRGGRVDIDWEGRNKIVLRYRQHYRLYRKYQEIYKNKT